MVLAAVLSMVRYVGDIENRDFVDRMHSYFTTNILVAFAIIVSFKVTSCYSYVKCVCAYVPVCVCGCNVPSLEIHNKSCYTVQGLNLLL